MGDTQEARDRHRQTLALEAMTSYLKELVPVMQGINAALKDFAKIATPAKVEVVKPDLELAKEIATHPEGGM